jgi:hypothetical protein
MKNEDKANTIQIQEWDGNLGNWEIEYNNSASH